MHALRLELGVALGHLEQLVSDLGGVRVIAVDGHSAAGKSTFAQLVATRFGAALVAGDDFYRVMDPVERAGLSTAEGADRYYDWQRMRDEAVIPLRAGHKARYRPYDWDQNAMSSDVRVISPAEVVVLEGLFVARPELAAYVDINIVVETSAAARHDRQARRADASPDWLKRWDAAERWYFEHIRPVDTFDIRVGGDPGPGS